MEKSKKEKVVALLKSIESGDSVSVSYINPNKYIQHNLGVADGLAGFRALLAQLPANSAKVNTVRVFQDGDFVFTHNGAFLLYLRVQKRVAKAGDLLHQGSRPHRHEPSG